METPSIQQALDFNARLKNNSSALQQIIDANIGQQVLVKIMRDQQDGCTGFGGHGYIHTVTDLLLGIPAQKTEIVKDPLTTVRIPMNFHMTYDNSFPRRKWEKRQGPIEITMLDIVNLGKGTITPVLDPDDDTSGGMRASLEVIAGDLDVAAHFTIGYFLLPEEYQCMRKDRQQGKISDEQLKQRISALSDFDLNYLFAVKQLGAKPLPELQKLVQNYKAGVVEAIYGRTDKPRERLSEALALDMHKEPQILELKREGVTVNVPEFIRSQCKRYNVEIPE